jgi:hypothetical protein
MLVVHFAGPRALNPQDSKTLTPQMNAQKAQDFIALSVAKYCDE